MNARAELAGRVAVVTGGSGAIGGAILDAFAQAGAIAVALDVAKPPQPDRLWAQCDVRDDASVAAAIAAVQRQHKRLDFAVHAAGISRDAVLWKLSVDDWDLVQAVNLRGAFLMMRHAVPVMRSAGGRIVLIGSINGSRGKFGSATYSASKAGLIGLAKTAAREVGRFAITVNVIEPGWVRTPLTEQVPQPIRDAALAESLLGSFVETADVAAAVLYLCGPAGRAVTGQILRVDAGQFLGCG